jgi:uncharacterized protein (TIGR02996 family)
MGILADDVAALVAAVKADPADPELRLVLADALEESGERGQADWLRADYRFATERPSDPRDYRLTRAAGGPAGVLPLWSAAWAARVPGE